MSNSNTFQFTVRFLDMGNREVVVPVTSKWTMFHPDVIQCAMEAARLVIKKSTAIVGVGRHEIVKVEKKEA